MVFGTHEREPADVSDVSDVSRLWTDAGESVGMKVFACDGCDVTFPLSDLTFFLDYGHECRYCQPCAEMYKGWQIVTTMEEARRQRELDLWQMAAREKVPLIRMPMDFGPSTPPQRVPLGTLG